MATVSNQPLCLRAVDFFFFSFFLNLMRISNTANYVLTVTDRATCVTKDMSTYESKKSTDTCYDCKADLVVLTSLHAVNGLR